MSLSSSKQQAISLPLTKDCAKQSLGKIGNRFFVQRIRGTSRRPPQPVLRSPAAMPLIVAASAWFNSSLSSPARLRRNNST